jgi:BRCT domain type II-containing protein
MQRLANWPGSSTQSDRCHEHRVEHSRVAKKTSEQGEDENCKSVHPVSPKLSPVVDRSASIHGFLQCPAPCSTWGLLSHVVVARV